MCGRVYAGGRGFCPIDSIELTEEHEVDLPHTGAITNYMVITPMQYPGQTETEPFARVFVLLDGIDVVHAATSRSSTLPGRGRPRRRCGSRPCGRPPARTSTAAADGWRLRRPHRLEAHRRARRRRPRPREQDLLMMADHGPDDIAMVGLGPDAHGAPHRPRPRPRCCSSVITDAIEPPGLTRADIDFTCPGSCDYITGQAFSFVHNLDAIGAWPPEARLPRGDGRRLGALRGVGAPPGGRHRHRRGDRLGPLLHRATRR